MHDDLTALWTRNNVATDGSDASCWPSTSRLSGPQGVNIGGRFSVLIDRGQTVKRMLDALRRDGKHAMRRLVKDWQFSAGAIVILALGIGANTAVFSLLNNTLFQPHPFTDSKRLVNLYQNDAKTGEPEGVSYPAFLDLQQETAVFAGVAASNWTRAAIRPWMHRAGRALSAAACSNMPARTIWKFSGMRPSLGRWFSADEERRAEPVAVLGWTVWTRDFGADPNVLGQTLIVGGTPVQVIGVGPMTLNSSQNNAWSLSLWMPISRIEPHRPAGPARSRARWKSATTCSSRSAPVCATA